MVKGSNRELGLGMVFKEVPIRKDQGLKLFLAKDWGIEGWKEGFFLDWPNNYPLI